MPSSWENNLWNLELLETSEEDSIFTANVGGMSGQPVLLKHYRPKTSEEAARLTRQISVLSAFAGRPGFINMYKSHYATCHSGRGWRQVQPETDAFLLMESSLGTLEDVVLGGSFASVDHSVKIRLFVDVLRAVQELREKKLFNFDLRPHSILVVGAPDAPQEWHAVLSELGSLSSEPGGPWPVDKDGIKRQMPAPEDCDPARDTWHVGALLYHLFSPLGAKSEFFETGNLLFDGSLLVLEEEEPDLTALILGMLHAVPSYRTSLQRVLEVLTDYARDRDIDISPRKSVPSLRAWSEIDDAWASRSDSILDELREYRIARNRERGDSFLTAATALNGFPEEWNNNLYGVKVMLETKHRVVFTGRVGDNSGQRVTIMSMLPAMDQLDSVVQVSTFTRTVAADDEVIAFYKAEIVDKLSRKIMQEVGPMAHVIFLLEGSVGTLAQVLRTELWWKSDPRSRLHLFADLVRTAIRTRQLPKGSDRFDPCTTLILGEGDEPGNWRTALFLDSMDDDPTLESEDIEELGEIFLQMYSSTPQGRLDRQLGTRYKDFKELESCAGFKAIHDMDPRLAELVERMLGRGQPQMRFLSEVLVELVPVMFDLGIYYETTRTSLPTLRGWREDASSPSTLDCNTSKLADAPPMEVH